MIRTLRFLKCFFLLFLLAISFAEAQYIGFQITDGRKKVEIPFEMHNNLIVVKVILNNAIPLKFILDTGVKTTILTEKTFSDLLSISYDREINLVGATGGRPVKAFVANQVSLQLPGVMGRGQALLVLEEDYLQLKNNIGIDVHGILGYELFRRFVVKIDYARGVLTLYEAGVFRPKRKYKRYKLLVENSKPYLLTTLLLNEKDSLDAKLMIDTGASQSFLLNVDSSPLIKLPEKKILGKLGRGLSGDIVGHFGRYNSVGLLPFSFDEPIVAFPTEESYKILASQSGRTGSIGGGVLTRFHVVFDYFNQKLYLKKNKNYRLGFEYNISGFDIQAGGESLTEFEVNYVRPGSPAEQAGLMVGDKLISIKGQSVRDISLGELFSYLSVKNGKTLRLRIKRGKKTISFKFQLERFI